SCWHVSHTGMRMNATPVAWCVRKAWRARVGAPQSQHHGGNSRSVTGSVIQPSGSGFTTGDTSMAPPSGSTHVCGYSQISPPSRALPGNALASRLCLKSWRIAAGENLTTGGACRPPRSRAEPGNEPKLEAARCLVYQTLPHWEFKVIEEHAP